MTASSVRSCAASQWRLLGVCLRAAVTLLAVSSDACVLPPPFEAMDPINPKPYYQVGEQVEYRCKKGFIRQPFYLMVATCEQNHTWLPLSDDACKKERCPYLNPPRNGRIEYINETFAWGDQAHFSCNYGFFLVGDEIVYCQLIENKSRWNTNPPKCKKITCGPPPKISNGSHTFSDVQVFEYYDAVIYSCGPVLGPDKLSLVGNEVLYCAAHEQWSGEAPVCKVVKCPRPVIKNGRQISGFADKYYYKATVKLQCDSDYHLNDSETVFCGSENTWQPSLPQCLKGPKPTHPVKPPVYNYPGYPNPREGIFDPDYDAWIILLIIIIIVMAASILILLVHEYIRSQTKSKKEIVDSHKDIKFTFH